MLQVAVAIVAGLLVTLIANLCTTVYLHRTLSHRSLTLRKPADVGFRFVLWITTGIKPREWVAVHRKHHAFTDVPGRSPLAQAARLDAGAAHQRRPLPARGPQPRSP